MGNWDVNRIIRSGRVGRTGYPFSEEIDSVWTRCLNFGVHPTIGTHQADWDNSFSYLDNKQTE